ncbi:PREDICTED: uncharacterized protein LOC108357615 [Rhagoletis zephyria]|uniref:uncharacterized protein LOC108357615 n=1 Tax=Rhagoletis zephyria TaxID=28612 RepID=UPI0008114188|nr:PREDICTED: uncharacterized protein LOC108357615 [Rhagoletis zephyria]
MSSLLKCILGLCVVLCFVQFIEMARIARDDAAVKDAAVKDPAADLINNLQNLVGDVVEKLKTAVDSDAVKVSTYVNEWQLKLAKAAISGVYLTEFSFPILRPIF